MFERQQGGNYNFTGGQAMTRFANNLSPEQIHQLLKKTNEFSLAITQEDQLKSWCNHRSEDGTQDTLSYDNLTGQACCYICGYTFKPIDPSESIDDIQNSVDRIVDILQTIKLMYVDLPPEVAKEYFPIIPLIEKIPQLFIAASKSLARHDSSNWAYNKANMGGAYTMFQNLENMMSGGMMGQQPNPNMNMGAMGGAPNMGTGMMPPRNDFGYPGASAGMGNPVLNNGMVPPNPGYQSSTTGYQFVPGGANNTNQQSATQPPATTEQPSTETKEEPKK